MPGIGVGGMTNLPPITAHWITDLLAKKHIGDIFVPQCKTGSTWDTSHQLRILDVWAMARSYSNPRTYGYEIKVSRGDFLQDEKWPEYLQYCDTFYFVAPPGIINKEELPTDVGLMETTKNGAKLRTTKKAVQRKDVVIPDSIFKYILFSRVSIDGHIPGGSIEFWKAWMARKEFNWEFGHRVGEAIQKRIAEEITAVEDRNTDLVREIEKLKDVKAWCEDQGIDISKVYTKRNLDRLLNPNPIANMDLDDLEYKAQEFIQAINQARGIERKENTSNGRR